MNAKKVKTIKEYLAPARAALNKADYRKLLKMTKHISKGVPRKDYQNVRSGDNQDTHL